MTRRLRLAPGLVRLTYVTMHLLNHALGLISLAAMERTLVWVSAIWSQYFRCELVVSKEVIWRAGLIAPFRWEQIELRGKQEKQAVAIIGSGSDLPERDAAAEAVNP
jgi:adenylate cyclase